MRVNNSGICGYSDRGGGIYVYTTYNMHLCTTRTAMEGQNNSDIQTRDCIYLPWQCLT